MRYVDLVMQTLIISTALFGVGLALFVHDDYSGIAFLAQACLGVWQMASSLTSVVTRSKELKRKTSHLVLASGYLLISFTMLFLHTNPFGEMALMVFLIGPPWLLAIYYYLTTWRVAFPRYNSYTEFLPYMTTESLQL